MSDNLPTDEEIGTLRQLDGRDKYPEETLPNDKEKVSALNKRAETLEDIEKKDLGNDGSDFTKIHLRYVEGGQRGESTEKQIDPMLRRRAAGLRNTATSLKDALDATLKDLDDKITEAVGTVKEDNLAYSSIERQSQTASGYLKRIAAARRRKSSGRTGGAYSANRKKKKAARK